MKTIAIIEKGVVVNIALWDGKHPWDPEAVTVELPKDSGVNIGWAYDGKSFSPPKQEASE